ncbi:hypothetical protein [Streptomyces luteogriseus]|uniref:hypothetical protein n=1 Tax=Streptomyces luteogriseus TaxID=68233 RepID=UPI003802D63B
MTGPIAHDPERSTSDRRTVDTITSDELDALYDTNQRLNRRAQALESELAAYRRAVGQWEVNERGTYIPHSSLRAIGKACGADILGSVRHLKHFQRVEQAEAAIERVQQACHDLPHEHARRILAALDGTEQTTTAATEATEHETTTRVFAALHRSAEQDVSRVIALYERWVKAGPPPLGTPIARWWDARLVELHNAILPPTADTTTDE